MDAVKQVYLVRYSVSATGTKVCAAFNNDKGQVWIEAIDFHPAPVEVR